MRTSYTRFFNFVFLFCSSKSNVQLVINSLPHLNVYTLATLFHPKKLKGLEQLLEVNNLEDFGTEEYK